MNVVKCIRIAATCCLLLALLCGVSTAAEGQKFVCKVSSSNSADFPPYRAFDEMVAYLTERSGGRISVIKYDDSQLGSQVEVLEALQMGVVQMTMPLTADLAGFDQRIQVLDLPFLFTDFESVRKALHGELGKRFDAIFDKQSFKCMGYNPTGIRSITNNKRAIYPRRWKFPCGSFTPPS